MSGLELVTNSQQKLSKDLLQNGLRPILSNLSEAKKLTTQGLEGLSRLLMLLTGYFKAEIGKKLLDHLNSLVESKILEDARCQALHLSNEVSIFVGIVEIFHLLPNTANIFMDSLVNAVLILEDGLRRTESSPFRKALAKFLCKYSQDSLNYFIPILHSSPAHLSLFTSILGMPEGQSLKRELISNQDKLLSILSQDNYESIVTFIKVLYAIISSTPDPSTLVGWLKGNKQMIKCLFSLFKSHYLFPKRKKRNLEIP